MTTTRPDILIPDYRNQPGMAWAWACSTAMDYGDICRALAKPRVSQPRLFPKLKRNALCPCSSGKKFKDCCLLKDDV